MSLSVCWTRVTVCWTRVTIVFSNLYTEFFTPARRGFCQPTWMSVSDQHEQVYSFDAHTGWTFKFAYYVEPSRCRSCFDSGISTPPPPPPMVAPESSRSTRSYPESRPKKKKKSKEKEKSISNCKMWCVLFLN